ncbi:hypothetical protein ACN42_g2871 [Penicillium freii]|uniref:Uncharacterized protein n=1 Tax=Penicillium freii TaxID=48697 RepID=A0A117NQM9_PENFR|nr:hypothetical protein ACN42_g2871 [Penicillium freii]
MDMPSYPLLTAIDLCQSKLLHPSIGPSGRAVSWSSGYDFPLTNAIRKCSGKVLGSIPRETIFCIFPIKMLVEVLPFIGFCIEYGKLPD